VSSLFPLVYQHALGVEDGLTKVWVYSASSTTILQVDKSAGHLRFSRCITAQSTSLAASLLSSLIQSRGSGSLLRFLKWQRARYPDHQREQPNAAELHRARRPPSANRPHS
jgi:hypothetical protein